MKKFVSVLLMLCMLLPVICVSTAETAIPADGVYTGTGAGMHSNIEVNVTVENGAITAVDVISQDETPGISDAPIAQIPQRIIDAQSTDVDVVSAATFTSKGIIEAVNNALSSAPAEAEAAEFTPDLLVIGGGLAGITAAVRGFELGLHVLILEESARIGGCSQYAGGTVSGACFNIQRENGITDSYKDFYDEVVEIGGGETELNPELSKSHCQMAGNTIDWLDYDIGVDFASRQLVAGAYASFKTMRVTLAGDQAGLGGAQGYLYPLEDRLDEAIEAGFAKVMLNTSVTKLDVVDGHCNGVYAGEDYYTAPTILLATGGYCHNEELLKMAGFDNIVSQAPKTSNGSGFFLAKDVGGVFFNMDKLTTFYGGGVMTDGFEMTYGANTSYPNRVYVNKDGDRMGDEMTNDVHMWMDAPEDKLYIIVSGDTIDPEAVLLKYGITYIKLDNNGWDKLDEFAEEGVVAFKADTIEELGEKMGAANLAATIAKYNEDAKNGEDTVFARDPETMVALENGPFYALETVPYAYTGSTGGVRVNGEGKLWLEDDTVVDNLYLAGEILGPTCITGKYIFGGINHSMAMTWGKHAAEQAALALFA